MVLMNSSLRSVSVFWMSFWYWPSNDLIFFCVILPMYVLIESMFFGWYASSAFCARQSGLHKISKKSNVGILKILFFGDASIKKSPDVQDFFLLIFNVCFNWRTRADQVPVTIGIVNAPDRWPEFVVGNVF